MLVRRLNNLENMPIHGRFALDPHGELVLLYNIDNHMFYILETLYLLKHAL